MSNFTRPPSERTIEEHLERLRDVSLPEEARRQSENFLSFHRRLPVDYEPLPQLAPRKAVPPPGTPHVWTRTPEVNLDAIPAWGELVSTRASEVTQEEIRWIWNMRVPAGKLTVLAGDMGLGKSLMAAWLMSVVTTGGSFPGGGSCEQEGSVIYMAAEDDDADTTVPRLARARCNLERVHLTTTLRTREGTLMPFSITRDLAPLADLLERVGDCRLIVLDPVADYLFGVDEHKNAEVRKALNPLRDLARSFGVGIVLINHLNKSGGLKALYRVSGTHGFVGIGRMNWLLCEHPFDNDRRLLVPIKLNLVGRQMGLSFRITGEGCIAWDPEPVDWSADDALRLIHTEKYAEDRPKKGRPAEKSAECRKLIMDELSKGPSSKLRQVCAAVPQATYFRVLQKLRDEKRIERAPSENGDECYKLCEGVEAQQSLPLNNRVKGLKGPGSNGANGAGH